MVTGVLGLPWRDGKVDGGEGEGLLDAGAEE